MAVCPFTLVPGSNFATLLSSDTKPASNAGEMLVETDTGALFYSDGAGGWTQAVGTAAWGGITGALADQTDLNAAITTRAYSSTLPLYQVSSAISSAAFTLSTVYATSTHASRHITGGADIISDFNTTSSGLAPLSGSSTTNFLRGDGLWASPAGGSDPWTYLQVSAAHFSTSTIAFRDITGLRITPGTNSTYEFESLLMLKTSTTTVNPRIQYRWPTNTSSVGWMNLAQTNATQLMSFGNETSTQNTLAAGGLATTTAAWPFIGGGMIRTFGGTTSSFALMMATETAGAFVSTMIGSYLKYRTIP